MKSKYETDIKTCLRLDQLLYGLKQSGRLWNNQFVWRMKKLGYERLLSDQSIFYKKIGNKFIIFSLYVDDILGITSDKETMQQLTDDLQKTFKTKALGAVHWLVGMKISRNRVKGCLLLNQETYVNTMLNELNMQHIKSVDTPLVEESKIPQNLQQFKDDFHERAVFGKMMFLSVTTRPDIAPAVAILGQYLNNSSARTRWRIKRILRYLSGTRDHGINFYRSNKPFNLALSLQAYVDASYGNCPATRRSRTGVII